ncbi:hypothetical protein HNP84_002613 [Thermocatellispora tengchongensis]|uniref:Uncharacterized protein n=1 Tax=Thermocatellispora tengchongensis TaxID=1073253 RepID=A0A840P0I4_9ACTN|nr:hypothetical protein [Thermocatellispora tengchongensis]MBB5132892.1 hypothetical protein [Thermocatellispora tengchongensis]
MYSDRKPVRRLLLFALLGLVLVFVVRQPERAASLATSAFNGLMTVADALATFVGNVG